MPQVPDRKTQASLEQTQQLEHSTTDLGEIIEEYLARAEETGRAPELNAFLTEFPGFGDELRTALEGLALMNGLLSSGSSHSRVHSILGPESANQTMLKPGTSLAGYRIVRELGRGGMGVVYEAVHVDLDRPVALKILKPWSGGSARRRFLNEARTSAALHHTNIVPVFDVGQSGETTYYAMQKIDGEGLDRHIRRLRGEPIADQGPDSASDTTLKRENSRTKTAHDFDGNNPSTQPAGPHSITVGQAQSDFSADHHKIKPYASPWPGFDRWVAQVGSQAAMALDYAHKRQVIHRDIKPSNLILDKIGNIWVADFGLALRLDDPGLSRGDGVLGTPRYTSPEQAARKVVDHRTDIYSLGATLYELITGRPPFDGESSDEVIRKILGESPVAPRLIDPRISRDFETIILKAMARRPEDRYATGAELADDLQRFLNYEPVRARRIGPVGRLWRLSRRHPAVSAVTVASLAIIIGIAAFAYRRIALERDDAVAARIQTQVALDGEKQALEKARSAMGRQLWREASLVRLSAVPNRRDTILDLVSEAMAYEPEADLLPKLRDEVVAALSLSDVRQEQPLVYDHPAGFKIINGENRAMTIDEAGKTASIWNLDSSRNRLEIPLDQLSGIAPPAEPREPQGRGGFDSSLFGGLFSRRLPRIMLSVGPIAGIVQNDGLGISWIDTRTGEPKGEWKSPGQKQIFAAMPVGAGPRLLTIEWHPNPLTTGSLGRTNPFGVPRPGDELVVAIHHLEKPDQKPLIIERIQISGERGRFSWPVLSISPDGSWLALSQLFDEKIRILDTADGHELATIAAQVPVSSIAAGPQRLLAIAGGGSIRLWRNEIRVDNDKAAWSPTALPTIGTHLGAIRQIQFASNRNLIAASGRTSGIEIWNADTGEAVATLSTSGPSENLDFAANGELLLASMSDPRQGGIRLWSIDEPVAKSVLGNAPEQVLSLSVQGSRPSTLFAQTLTGQVWYDTPGEGPMRQLRLPNGNERFSAVRTDTKGRLWTFADGTLSRFDNWSPANPDLSAPTTRHNFTETADGGMFLRGFGLTRMTTGLAFARNSDRVFTNRGSHIYLLDPALGPAINPIVFNDDEAKTDFRREEPVFPREKSGRSRRDGDRPERERPPGQRGGDNFSGMGLFRGMTSFSRRLNVSPDGNHIALLRGDSWEFRDLEATAEPVATQLKIAKKRPFPADTPTTSIAGLSLSPDGSRLALAQREGTVTIIDVPSWSVRKRFTITASDPADTSPIITDISFKPDQPDMLAIVTRGEVAFWSLSGGEPSRHASLPVATPSLVPMVWSQDGSNLYLVEEERRIVRWNLNAIFRKIESLEINRHSIRP